MFRAGPAVTALAALALLSSFAPTGTEAFATAHGSSVSGETSTRRTRARIDTGGFRRGTSSPGTSMNSDTSLRAGEGGDDGGLRGLSLRDTVEVGDRVVCKRSVPEQGIYENASYEVTSVYVQSFDEETQTVSRVQFGSLDEGAAASSSGGSQLYLTLYSPEYHGGRAEGAVVTPEEAGLVTVRRELAEAAWLAVPGFVWIAVASTFYGVYHERTGGSLADAFLGR